MKKEREVKDVIGSVLAGTFFAVLIFLMLLVTYGIKAMKIKLLSDAYKMYLSENGYKQPTRDEMMKYYKEAVRAAAKK